MTFFILSPFPTAGGSSADDTGGLAAFDVRDDHEQLLESTSNQYETIFLCGMIRIRDRERL